VFQNLLKSLIVQNSHRVTVEMVPDVSLEAKMCVFFDVLRLRSLSQNRMLILWGLG